MKLPILSTDTAGPLTLYTWADRAPKRDGMVFRVNPDESLSEWSAEVAKFRVDGTLKAGYNVKILNAKEQIVYFARKGVVTWPPDVNAFWRECGK